MYVVFFFFWNSNNNQLIILDIELINYKRLVTLQLKSNPFIFISIHISECILLQELGLSETFIVTLPASMSKLKKLKKLDLGKFGKRKKKKKY